MSIRRDPTIVLVPVDSPLKRIDEAVKVRDFPTRITLLAHSFHKMTNIIQLKLDKSCQSFLSVLRDETKTAAVQQVQKRQGWP